VPESELTFTTVMPGGAPYMQPLPCSGTKTEVARIEEQSQVGRGTKAKPRTTVAHQTGPQDQRRVADARDQQALALGDRERAGGRRATAGRGVQQLGRRILPRPVLSVDISARADRK